MCGTSSRRVNGRCEATSTGEGALDETRGWGGVLPRHYAKQCQSGYIASCTYLPMVADPYPGRGFPGPVSALANLGPLPCALAAPSGRAAAGADVAGSGRLHLRAARVAERRVQDSPARRLAWHDVRDRDQLDRRLRRPADRRLRVLLALLDALDPEPGPLVGRKVLQGELAEHVVHQGRREPDVRILRDARGLEPHVHEL